MEAEISTGLRWQARNHEASHSDLFIATFILGQCARRLGKRVGDGERTAADDHVRQIVHSAHEEERNLCGKVANDQIKIAPMIRVYIPLITISRKDDQLLE